MLKSGNMDAFQLWCFGEGYEEDVVTGDTASLMERWNKLHGDVLLLKGTDSKKDSMKAMLKLWKDHKDNISQNEPRDYP